MRLSSVPRLAALLIALLAAAPPADAQPSPRIVHGTLTSDHPTSGALLAVDPTDPTDLEGLCSGTLIGCRTFLTAAHCVCPEDVENAAGCLAEGTTDPSALRVFLPNGGIQAVESVAIDPDYSFAEHGDAAVVRLATIGGGITPSAINTVGRLADGSRGTIVGFGSTGGPPFLASDYGVKRDGKVTTGPCADDVNASAHVCWNYDGADASTCSGDSGGPLFADFGAGPVVAGITSGGESFDCEPPDQVFDTDVYVVRDWIQLQLANDSTGPCGSLAPIGHEGAAMKSGSATLTPAEPNLVVDFDVPAGTRLLRVVLNGQEFGGSGFQRQANDIDLSVKPVVASSAACEDLGTSVYGDCEISLPSAGAWQAVATLVDGVTATTQLTVSTFAASLAGDANCDDRLSAPDLIALATLIGHADPPPCPNADADGDGMMDAADQPLIVQNLFAQ